MLWLYPPFRLLDKRINLCEENAPYDAFFEKQGKYAVGDEHCSDGRADHNACDRPARKSCRLHRDRQFHADCLIVRRVCRRINRHKALIALFADRKRIIRPAPVRGQGDVCKYIAFRCRKPLGQRVRRYSPFDRQRRRHGRFRCNFSYLP